MEFITINKLFEKLPEEELKAVQVYYDEYIPDKFVKYKINVKVLFISLVFKDGKQQKIDYKSFRELCPQCIWLSVPKKAFSDEFLNKYLTKRLRKVYIRAERKNYKTSFYHESVAKDIEDQSPLKRLTEERNKAQLEIVNELAEQSTIEDDEIDPDDF